LSMVKSSTQEIEFKLVSVHKHGILLVDVGLLCRRGAARAGC
jgi:hypothetical protein